MYRIYFEEHGKHVKIGGESKSKNYTVELRTLEDVQKELEQIARFYKHDPKYSYRIEEYHDITSEIKARFNG